jgi:hypothetical protein
VSRARRGGNRKLRRSPGEGRAYVTRPAAWDGRLKRRDTASRLPGNDAARTA